MSDSLKFQRGNRKNVLAVDPAKGKTGEKGCIFHRTVEMKQPQTITEPIKKPAIEYGNLIFTAWRKGNRHESLSWGRIYPVLAGLRRERAPLKRKSVSFSMDAPQ